MLVNDVSLRNLTGPELAKGFGFVQSKPSSAFTPVAVTPDELGSAFDGAKVALPLLSFINGEPFGKPGCGNDMTFDFPTLIAHAAKTRALSAGTILGAGTVSNRDADGGPGKPIAEGGLGYSCIAEVRTVETIRTGKPVTPFLKFGDRVLSASAFKGAEILASDATRGLIAERGKQDMDSEIGRFPRLFRAVETIPGLTWPSVTFPARMSVWLGRREVRIMHIGRGHTAGDVVAAVPDCGVVISGALVE